MESSVAPRILILSDSGITVPATLTDLIQDRNFSHYGVPNKISILLKKHIANNLITVN